MVDKQNFWPGQSRPQEQSPTAEDNWAAGNGHGLFNDRRDTIGAGDFNNPKGTFEVTSHGYAHEDRWANMTPQSAKTEVVAHYRGQKNTKTWHEANRLAKQRTDHEARKWGMGDGAQYAKSYQEHLVRVMATKGPALAEKFGELRHRQSGYGRT